MCAASSDCVQPPPKLVRPVRDWVFTLNNPIDFELIDFSDEKDIRYAVYQLEMGESGTPHYQGYIEFNRTTRLSRCNELIPRAFFANRMGTRDEARNYCLEASKGEGFRLDGPWEFGDWNPKGQGNRTDWNGIYKQIKSGATDLEIQEAHPGAYAGCFRGIQEMRNNLYVHRSASQETEIRLFYGRTGTGKSRAAYERYPGAFWKEPGTKWWDGYQQEETVVMDEFRGSWMKLSSFLRIVDRYPLTVETKGSHMKFNSKRLIITSNLLPTEWWPHVHTLEVGALLRRFSHFHLFDGEGERVFGNYGLFVSESINYRSGADLVIEDQSVNLSD